MLSVKSYKNTMPHTNEIRSLFDLAGLSAPVIMITNYTTLVCCAKCTRSFTVLIIMLMLTSSHSTVIIIPQHNVIKHKEDRS
jgi:hypothetical protein